MQKIILISLLYLAASFYPAFAYIGPGGAVSGIGAFIALVAAILFAILGFFWFPIKRLLRKKEKPADSEESLVEEPESGDIPDVSLVEKDSSEK